MADKIAEVVSEAVEAVEDVVTKAETPEAKKEKKPPELNEEGEFLIRRISEEVTKGIAALLSPSKPDDDDDDEPTKPRKRKPPKPETKKSRGFLPNFFRRA